ncbi:hypothetical protein LUZ61_006548 [Rhynchospora tenuis]|uniref:Protein SNOWY COTYLEDON 3 n=1 Tax=Rhynchospora tenuis TaxID=198213 RepID=A0AAD5ZRY7_9POAL|nr:hypothetical protein LUZ61_006548 [Rhynchospora tenuis]
MGSTALGGALAPPDPVVDPPLTNECFLHFFTQLPFLNLASCLGDLLHPYSPNLITHVPTYAIGSSLKTFQIKKSKRYQKKEKENSSQVIQTTYCLHFSTHSLSSLSFSLLFPRKPSSQAPVFPSTPSAAERDSPPPLSESTPPLGNLTSLPPGSPTSSHMVAATTATVSLSSSGKSTADLPTRPRSPLIPSEKDNAPISHLRHHRRSSSISNSTTTSYSSSSTSSSSSRRYPSPLLNPPRPSTPPTLPQSRSRSADRSRPTNGPAVVPASTDAGASLCTTTRSLSVSFQGESFFIQTLRTKSASSGAAAGSARKPTPEKRRQVALSENSRPVDRWPASMARSGRQPNPLAKSLDCSLEKKDSILATVHLLQQSMVLSEDLTRRASFDGGDLSVSSDTDSVSSGSNSGIHEFSLPPRAKTTSRGISVPARFWQETNSRLRRFTEPNSRMLGSGSPPIRKSLSDSPTSSPRGSIRGSPSPLKTRTGSGAGMGMGTGPAPANAPSIINFAAEVRRAKKGENRIEEAHKLRLLDNRHLQWRCVNARARAALSAQRSAAEKYLYNAWRCTSELRDAVAIKRIKLQLLTQRLKLTSILRGQITYLEEWSLIEKDHSNSLSDATEALKASTLRLPVVGGAKADVQEVKEAVGVAVDVMNSMATSICSLLSKVEGAGSLVSELANVAAQEKSLLDQSRDLLSTVAALHVKKCSLQGHIIQRKRKQGQIHC